MRARRPFETPAAIVLPDHTHFMMTLPEGDHDPSTRIRLIKAGVSKRLPENIKGEGRKGERNIWHQRFWEHAIRAEKGYEAQLNNIHHNPVKQGYVDDADKWTFSTWHRFKRDYGKACRPE